jgi:sugar phosphate isomerase/epimerase
MTKLKTSACSANYGREDLFRIVDRVADHGFDGIELTVMYHVVPGETSSERRAEIRRYIAGKGLEISALHFIFAPGMKMTSDDPVVRQGVADHMVSVMQLAADLEAPVVVIGGGGVRSIPPSMAREDGFKRVMGVYTDVARRSEALGVVAGFEALNRYETNLGHTLAECCDLVDRLAHLHLPDSHRLAPGGGHIDFPPVIEALRNIGYRGYVSFEFFSISPDLWYLPTFEACDAEVRKGIEYLRQLGAREQLKGGFP